MAKKEIQKMEERLDEIFYLLAKRELIVKRLKTLVKIKSK